MQRVPHAKYLPRDVRRYEQDKRWDEEEEGNDCRDANERRKQISKQAGRAEDGGRRTERRRGEEEDGRRGRRM